MPRTRCWALGAHHELLIAAYQSVHGRGLSSAQSILDLNKHLTWRSYQPSSSLSAFSIQHRSGLNSCETSRAESAANDGLWGVNMNLAARQRVWGCADACAQV